MKPIALGLVVLAFSGCSFAREAFKVNAYSAPVHEPTTAEKLKAGEGTLDFETSLQMFGPPNRCAEAGQTKTCVWIQGGGSTDYVAVGNTLLAIPDDASTAQLVFTNDRLASWKLTGAWR